jgi:hypothetical protein
MSLTAEIRALSAELAALRGAIALLRETVDKANEQRQPWVTSLPHTTTASTGMNVTPVHWTWTKT